MTNDQLPPIEKYQISPNSWVDVVRCDMVEGGFKRLAIDGVYTKTKSETLVFASNSLGSGPLALTLSLQGYGKKVIIFLSKLDSISPNLALVEKMGGRLDFSGNADPSDSENLRKEALAKYTDPMYEVLPLGLENEEVTSNIVKIAKQIFSKNVPAHIWIATASGLTLRGLERVLPSTQFHAVLVKGNQPNVGKAQIYKPIENFQESAKVLPPYPSNKNYDAKVWEVLFERSKNIEVEQGTLIFNIAA